MGKKSSGGDEDDEDLLHPLPPDLSNDDLIQEILVRLPIKCVGQCKSVCKSWISLIESSSFIHLHTTFNSSASESNFGSFILLASVDKPSSPNKTPSQHSLISLSSSESLLLSSSESFRSSGWQWWRSTTTGHHDDATHCENQVFKVVVDNYQQLLLPLGLKLDSLGFPPDYFFKQIVVGSCHGLVCLYDEDDNNKVCLWNPATKKHRILPRPMDIGGVDWPHHLVVFGFDVETKDYKVVLLTGFKQEFYRPVSPIECICRVQVYSLSTDSWRLVEGITCLPGDPFPYQDQVLYLNGTSSCFFLARFFRTRYQPCIPVNNRFIISFDLTKETITPIQLPDHHRDQELYLSCLGDKKIALFTVNYQHGYRPYPSTGFSDDYNIWALLNEHGSSSNMNKDSWVKLHSFQIAVERSGERNIPRGISNDGKFALLETNDLTRLGKRMKLYHFVSKEVKRNFLYCTSVMSKANAYKPNPLVSIEGGNGRAY